MGMVALNAERTKIVETGSIEARWLVNEGDVPDYLEDAKKHPKMQAKMAEEAEARVEDEAKSAETAAEEKARRSGGSVPKAKVKAAPDPDPA